MDRELKALRRDVKVKDEKCVKMDDEVRQLHAAKQEEVSF
jgi:hypothetical protein